MPSIRDNDGNQIIVPKLSDVSGDIDARVTNVMLDTTGDNAGKVKASKLPVGLLTRTINFVIDGGGSAITTGVKGDVEVPFACVVTGVKVLADVSGSIGVDVWKDTYANFPPVDGDSITASAPPTISSATKSTNSTLTGWTTAIAAGDILRFNVDSATTITRATVSIAVAVTV